MKLQLRYFENSIRPCYVVTDDAGEMLPGQQEVTIEQRVGQRTCVIVRFVLDEEDFRLTDQRVVDGER